VQLAEAGRRLVYTKDRDGGVLMELEKTTERRISSRRSGRNKEKHNFQINIKGCTGKREQHAYA